MIKQENLSPSDRIGNEIFTCPDCPQFWTNDQSRYFFLEIKHNDFEFFVFLLDAEVNGEIL